jgi:uncharacterized membrane protein
MVYLTALLGAAIMQVPMYVIQILITVCLILEGFLAHRAAVPEAKLRSLNL